MSIYGSILENYIKNVPDIYYNKDKFDSGEINLCFITGHSGSGKSTMAHNSETKNIEVDELDDVLYNKPSFSMDNFKEYGDLIYSFFNTMGKKYYYDNNDIKNGTVKEYKGNYDNDIINDFVNYSIKYAKSHKNKKYIIEGIELFLFIDKNKLKDYAVYIKGTSRLISDIRAAKRDSKNDFPDKKDKLKRSKVFIKRILKFFDYNEKDFEKKIQNYRDYFTKLMNKEE